MHQSVRLLSKSGEPTRLCLFRLLVLVLTFWHSKSREESPFLHLLVVCIGEQRRVIRAGFDLLALHLDVLGL